MNIQPEENDKATLAELEARAKELESELMGVQTAIAILQARINNGQVPAQGHEVPLTPAWDTPIPISTPPQSQAVDQTTDTGNIFLQSLQPHHALRAKWGLGTGLENADILATDIPAAQEDSAVATDVRLFGLLPNGMPWEQRIPFNSIAQSSGIILGRDAATANVVLEDASISRAHLQFSLNEYGLVVSDMGSTNGTAINGVPVSPYDSNRALQDGDTLTLGYINLQVEFI